MRFKAKVLELVKKIPIGKVMTYKSLAKSAGNIKAVPAVGSIIMHCAVMHDVPTHRVICDSGFIGKFGLGIKEKERLLKKEGVKILDGFVDLSEHLHRR
jgi:O-6-methylguanine DNA methyltransferase